MTHPPVASRRPLCGKVRNYFKEYCSASSIHGIRYFGERTYFERAWWIIGFVMCLSCCAYFITMIYQKWERSPVIVSFATRETPIHEIPFPAVTICPESKAIKTRYSHAKVVKKMYDKEIITETEYKQASYMNLLCDRKLSSDLLKIYKNKSSLNTTFDNFYYSDSNFFHFIFHVNTPYLIDRFFGCEWMNREYPCTELFELILTDEGICATFNMLDNSKIYRDDVHYQDVPLLKRSAPKNTTWTLDQGYKLNEGIHTFPRRALYAGAKYALTIKLLSTTDNVDYTCRSMEGFKVTLHTPAIVPRPSLHYFRLPLNAEVISAVQPVMITTSETVREFKPEKRKCYFENEKPLRFFKLYTQRNCQLECLANFTYNWCWCVSFFMPREQGTHICGLLTKPCVRDAEERSQSGHLINLLGSSIPDKNNLSWVFIEEATNCGCLPLCTDLRYDVETSTSPLDWRKIFNTLHPNDSTRIHEIEKNEISASSLTIYFKNSQFVTSKRHELYGPTDFLGNFGGLLGLFTGFSILSLLEIIYFSTVRIVGNIKLYGNWWGREEHLEK